MKRGKWSRESSGNYSLGRVFRYLDKWTQREKGNTTIIEQMGPRLKVNVKDNVFCTRFIFD